MEKFSVLMSIFINESADNFRFSIESLLNQSIKPNQIVIVEDGPIDIEIDKLIIFYVQNNPSLITRIKLEQNLGLGNALNIGLKYCKYELVARMDSDDINNLNRFELQLERFSKHDNLVILGGQIREFRTTVGDLKTIRKVPEKFIDIKKFAKLRSPFNHPTVMFKKTKILDIGGYKNIRRKEDLDLFLRAIFHKGYYCENLPDILLNYRSNDENYKRRKSIQNCREYIQVMKTFRDNKFISNFDFILVIVFQYSVFLLPISIQKIITKKFLRKKTQTIKTESQ